MAICVLSCVKKSETAHSITPRQSVKKMKNAHAKVVETRRKNSTIEINEGENFHNNFNIKKDLQIYIDFCKNVRHLININGERADVLINRELNEVKFMRDGIYLNSIERKRRRKHLAVFDPRNIWKIRWDFFMGIWILYSVLIIPYRFGWLDTGNTTDSAKIFDYLVDALFFVDVLVNFNTAYYDSFTEVYVFDRSKIAVTYFTLWFWVDVVSAIPLEVFLILVASSNANFIRFVKLFRLIRLIRVIKLYRNSSWELYLQKLRISPALINLLLLAIQILFLCHFFACFWHYISLGEVNSWVTAFGFTDSSSIDTYIASLYFVVVTMLTVGYGDIHATTDTERIFASIAMLTAGLIFGALLSKVSLLLEKFDPQARAYREKMSGFKSYLDGIQINTELKNDAKEAYAYYLHERSSLDERDIFDELPQPTLVKLVDQIYMSNLHNIRVFSSYEKPFVVEFIRHMRPFQARKGHELFKEDDVLNDLVFISSGSITISKFNGTVNVPLGSCDDGDYFGDFEYLKNTTCIASYRAAANCNLVSVSHDVVLNASGKFLEAGKKFREEMSERYYNFMRVVESTMGKKKTDNQDNSSPQKFYFIDGSIEEIPTEVDDKEGRFNFSYHEKDLSNINRIVMRDSFGGLSVVEKDKSFLAKKWIIHPKDKMKIYWDFVIGMLVFMSLLISPIDVAFDTSTLGSTGDLLVCVFFMVDIVLSFRTAYESKIESAYVIDSILVAKHYLRTMFFVDFISSFPIIYITNSVYVPNSMVKLLRVSRLVRLAKVLKLRLYLNYLETISGISSNVIDMLVLIVKVVVIGHLIACIWWGLSTVISSPGSRWYENYAIVQEIDLANSPVSTQYLWSFYWTAATLTTVGYGDIHATNTGERVLNIFILLVGASVFGFIVANVSTIIDHVDRKRSAMTDRVAEISEYLKSKNCSSELADSILNHFRQVYSLQLAHHGRDFLSALPIHMKNRILLVQYNSKIRHISVFRHISNKSVCLYLFELMNPIFYQPGQVIIQEGDPGNEILFFVSGNAVALRKANKSPTNTRTSHLLRSFSTLSEKRVETGGGLESDDGKNLQSKHSKPISFANQRSEVHRRRGRNGSQQLQPNVSNVESFLRSSQQNVAAFLRDALLDGDFPEQPEKPDLYADIKSWMDDDDQVKERGLSMVGKLMPGHFIGHAAVLNQCNHKVSVVATSSVCAYEMEKKALSKLIRVEPTVAIQFQHALAAAIMQQNKKFDKVYETEGPTHFIRDLRRKAALKFGKSRRKSSSTRMKPVPSATSPRKALKINACAPPDENIKLSALPSMERKKSSKRAKTHRIFFLDGHESDPPLDFSASHLRTRKNSKKLKEVIEKKGISMTGKLRSAIQYSLRDLQLHKRNSIDRGKMSILLHRRWSFSDTYGLSSRDTASEGGDDNNDSGDFSPKDLMKGVSQALFSKRRSAVPSRLKNNSIHSMHSWDEKSSDEVYSFQPVGTAKKRLRRPTFPFINNKTLYKFDAKDSSIL